MLLDMVDRFDRVIIDCLSGGGNNSEAATAQLRWQLSIQTTHRRF
jgi:hypothetical protein